MKAKFIRIAAMAVLILAAMSMGQAQVPITLNQGWNWISYPHSEPMSISEALSGFTPTQGDVIKSQTDGNSVYQNGVWRGTLTTFIPGKGYKYESHDGTVKTFIFGGAANDPSALPEAAMDGEFTVAANGTKVRFSPGNLQCRIDPNKESQITLGTGTSTMAYMPYNTYYKYSFCQMIYKAGELAEAGIGPGSITGLAFESYSPLHYLRNNITIWMSATTLTTAPSTSVSTSEMTQVFAGSLIQQDGWTPVYFNAPFTWDGESNVMVTVVMNHGSYSNPYIYWQRSNAGFTCSSYNYTDSNAYDPGTTTYSMYTTSNRPNTRFNGKGGVTWRFAEKQWDYIGEGNANVSSSYTGWIDMFGWGTSGHPHRAKCWQPWSYGSSDYFYAYDDSNYGLYDQTGEADWGCNAISNGGNKPNQWRTLTHEEWDYMLNTRSGKRYAKAQVNGINGLIVLPDGWKTSYYSLNSTNTADAAFSSNTITATQWQTLEQHGAVFLPAGGYRMFGNSLIEVDDNGSFWSSSTYEYAYSNASSIWFDDSDMDTNGAGDCSNGCTVRLVCQSNPRIRTLGVTGVTTTTATVSAEVDHTGTVGARGICWNTTGYPTETDSHISAGTGKGSFSKELTGLQPNTTYHVRAYAKISGTYRYGNELTFTTNGQLTVTTTALSSMSITPTSAACGGTVTGGDQNVTARGVCWSTSQTPTLDDSHSNDGRGTGSFSSMLENLTPGTTYYVRAYATTAEGTTYGNQLSFTTALPAGVINGLFSVSATQQMYFSQGNLQYQASTDTWRFATNQWDYVGGITGNLVICGNVYENGVKCSNNEISYTYSGWIDLFGWGTSGYNHGAVCYVPWSTSTNEYDYYAYGLSYYDYNLYDQTGEADWGYNAISNGGNTVNQWRTLTEEEWTYVFNTRATTSGIRYAKANVNNVNGMILLPDDWSTSFYSLNNTNSEGVDFSSNTITSSQWNTLEQHGAVFLPSAGYRSDDDFDYRSVGHYWTASCDDSGNALGVYHVLFDESDLVPDYGYSRSKGYSVRLVRDAQ